MRDRLDGSRPRQVFMLDIRVISSGSLEIYLKIRISTFFNIHEPSRVVRAKQACTSVGVFLRSERNFRRVRLLERLEVRDLR